MRKLKIGITCYPTVGGSGVIATELGKMLAERGHEIHFITSSVPFRLNKVYSKVFFHEVEVNQYSVFQFAPYDIALASKMADVIKNEQLDVLHVHYAIPHAVCAALAREMSGSDIKIVTTLHGTDITVLGQDLAMQTAIQFGIERSDVVTAVSDSLKRETYEKLEISKEIETIYNFVDESVFKVRDLAPLKSEFGIRQDERVLIHVSNFRKIKRIQDVVATFEKVRAKIPAKLLLVGDGPERRHISNLVRGSEFSHDILFLGKQENVEELFAISDVKLLLSEKESFGLVLLEAMACGVPGVGTDIGGIPEVIEHGVNGYVASLGDIDAISNYVLEILKDDATHARFREAALKTVQEKFRSEKIIKQYEDVYYRLVEEREKKSKQ